MSSPRDVEAFFAEHDVHPGDRVDLFRAIAGAVSPSTPVLYAGSFVDVTVSTWFDDVTYLDMDRRAATFFAQQDAVDDLVARLRREAGGPAGPASVRFAHADYRESVQVTDGSMGLLVSLFAGFVSEHATPALAIGGTLLVNPSHGDAAMASIDPRYELSGAVVKRTSGYAVVTDDLGRFLVPKREQEISVASLHASGRGVAYTRPAFAYLFRRVA